MLAKERRIVKRYSAVCKQRIVSEIERGEISVAEAQKRYDIRDGYKIKCVNTLFSSSADTLVCESLCGFEERMHILYFRAVPWR